MSNNEITIEAPRERVFAVLADASSYADWVVGAQEVRGADADWPDAGTALRHTQGVGPLVLRDETRVLESDPPARLVLSAQLDSLGSMRVTLELSEAPGGGTRVVMREAPEDGFVAVARNPVSDWLLAGRNVFSLRRLKALAEGG